jgi:hypothetical protein
MNEYEVTYTNGEVAVIAARTAEAAQAIAEDEADRYGCRGLTAVSVVLLVVAVA